MRFNMHDFIMKGLIAAIGVQSDYWVILEAARWFEKGLLLEDDLAYLEELIDQKNNPVTMPEPENELIENLLDEEE